MGTCTRTDLDVADRLHTAAGIPGVSPRDRSCRSCTVRQAPDLHFRRSRLWESNPRPTHYECGGRGSTVVRHRLRPQVSRGEPPPPDCPRPPCTTVAGHRTGTVALAAARHATTIYARSVRSNVTSAPSTPTALSLTMIGSRSSGPCRGPLRWSRYVTPLSRYPSTSSTGGRCLPEERSPRVAR